MILDYNKFNKTTSIFAKHKLQQEPLTNRIAATNIKYGQSAAFEIKMPLHSPNGITTDNIQLWLSVLA